MTPIARNRSMRVLVAVLATAVALTSVGAARASPGGGAGLGGGSSVPDTSRSGAAGSGGAPLGGLDPTRTSTPAPSPRRKLRHGTWFHGVTITEYWPAPESWFVGRMVIAPGLPGEHRVDWLYSATGVSMEGEGIGLDGRLYHLNAPGTGGWVTAAGHSTSSMDGWSAGSPFWRAGAYWRNQSGAVTFPRQSGGWSNGRGRVYVPLPGVSFAAGASLPLRFYQSIAVDPSVIALGSHVYIPAYAHDGHGGWFVARDTGGAIAGRHVDVYRSPPASQHDQGLYLTAVKVYVVPPGA